MVNGSLKEVEKKFEGRGCKLQFTAKADGQGILEVLARIFNFPSAPGTPGVILFQELLQQDC